MINLASKHKKPIIVLVGRLGKNWDTFLSKENAIVFPISAGEFSKEELLKNTSNNLMRTTEQIARLIYYNRKQKRTHEYGKH